MTSGTRDSSDSHIKDLRYLAKETTLKNNLEACSALVAQLPETLISSSAPTYIKARVLLAVLQAIVDRAHTSIKTDHNDAGAGLVLAAGAVMGLVTEGPNGYVRRPSEMTRKAAAGNKEVRQGLAAEWLVPPLTTVRGFRSREQACLDAFWHAWLDFLEDESAVRALAQRLGTGQSQAADTPVVIKQNAEHAAPNTPSWLSRHWKQLGVVAAGLVLVGAGLGVVLSLTSSPSGSPSHGSAANGPTSSGAASIGLPPGHKTYVEREGHIGEKWTYTNPFNPADTGPSVQPLQKVRVSCKVYAPSFGSVSPDGYWYRLASLPYDNRDYGIANTFLNGDPVVGTSNGKQTNVDRNVPNCPS
jgi:hypothetical protein